MEMVLNAILALFLVLRGLGVFKGFSPLILMPVVWNFSFVDILYQVEGSSVS